MNYYIIEYDNPGDKLRHYKNSRVANYTLEQINLAVGFAKYAVIADNEPVITLSVKQNYNVDPLAPVG